MDLAHLATVFLEIKGSRPRMGEEAEKACTVLSWLTVVVNRFLTVALCEDDGSAGCADPGAFEAGLSPLVLSDIPRGEGLSHREPVCIIDIPSPPPFSDEEESGTVLGENGFMNQEVIWKVIRR